MLWQEISLKQGASTIASGAGGTIDAAVAKEFAAEGAEAFISGRTKASVDAAAKQITANGGTAHVSVASW